MAEHSITQLLSIINQQIDSQESLNTYLLKAETLLEIAMNDGFLSYSTASIYYYLWVLSDVVEKARKFNEDSLNILLRNISKQENFFAEK
jgi:hypothetical protein